MVQIVKLGGSVITTKGQQPAIREDALDRLTQEIAPHADELVLVHGAGCFGHPLARAHGIDAGVTDENIEPTSEVHRQVRMLNVAVLEALGENAGPCLSVSPFGLLGCNDGAPGGWNLVPVHRVLELEAIPVLFGDIVLDTQRGATVLSGDRIVVELARFLDAEQAIFALDQDGVYSHPPEHEEAQLLEEPGLEELIAARDKALEAGPEDATGGMAGKLDATLAIARHGTSVALVGGLQPGRVADALDGDVEGTFVDAEEVAG